MLEAGNKQDEEAYKRPQGMKKAKINLSIPASLSEITLGEYQRYVKILNENTDEEGNISDGASEFLNIKALEIFCGLDTKQLYNIPLSMFDVAVAQIQKCFEEEKPLVKHFKFNDPNGVEQHMGFIPNLHKWSIGENVDVENYMQDWSTMHKAMAVLYRPIRVASKDKYKIDDYDGTSVYADAMKEIPVSIAFGAMLFFYRLGTRLCEYIAPFLAHRADLSSQQRQHLLQIGDGIQASLRYAEETYSNSIKQLGLTFTKQ